MNLCQVEIKRTIPKGSSQANDFKTKKIFVGGIPTSVNEGLDSSFLLVACYYGESLGDDVDVLLMPCDFQKN